MAETALTETYPTSALSTHREDSLRMSEIYVADQGEGQYAGTPSVFVRTTGCNLRCWFCDTPHTSWNAEGETQSVADIVTEVLKHNVEHVVITGGEPLIQPAIVPLTKQLKAAGRFLTIETAGTLFRPLTADLISLSPKLANSTPDDKQWNQRHDQLRHAPTVIEQFRQQFICQWKFVVDQPEDLVEVDAYVSSMNLPADEVWLMPQSRTPAEVQEKTAWLQSEAENRGWQLSPRLHIERFGNVRGK
jgi:7-carboxy-7-deazaguanine synthase